MLGLFLGAGFSKWAADLPVAAELFDFGIDPWGPREERRLAIVKGLKEDWDRRHPDGLAERFIAYALTLTEKNKRAVLWYIVRRLSRDFIWTEFYGQRGRRHHLMIDENRKWDICGVVRAHEFLKRARARSLCGIVTTNYDMLVEFALGTRAFNYGIRNESLTGRGPYPLSEWRNPVMLTGRLPLAKIHGSVSWDATERYTDGRRGLTGDALIAAPTPEKRPPEPLRPLWDLAEAMLRETRSLLVFGFAFNEYDHAVLQLLKRAAASVKNVLIVDIEPNIAAAQVLWPHANVSTSKPPPERDAGIREFWERVGVTLNP